MPRAALPSDVRTARPQGRRTNRADPAHARPRQHPDDRAVSGDAAGPDGRAERQAQVAGVKSPVMGTMLVLSDIRVSPFFCPDAKTDPTRLCRMVGETWNRWLL